MEGLMFMRFRTTSAAIMAAALCLGGASATAFAYNYDFGSGPTNADVFGKPTGYDEPAQSGYTSTNERRNKDAAYLPPPYFYGSGEIPTDTSSLYHNNNTPNGAGGGNSSGANTGSIGNIAPGSSSVSVNYPTADGLMASTSVAAVNSAPLYYDDNSIGTLHIAKLNKTLKVFEGESLENMKRGIGHFEFTSTWDGLVGFAGHNRGGAAYFSFVKNLAVGDKISYTTKYGVRVYAVYSKVKISETDYSGLAWRADNEIALITCVENESALRWLVIAKEVAAQ
jgi:sortase A